MALLSNLLRLNAKLAAAGFTPGVRKFPEMLRHAGLSLTPKFELKSGGRNQSLEQALSGLEDTAAENALSIDWKDGASLEAAWHPRRTKGTLNLIVSLPVGKEHDFVQRSDQAVRLAGFLASAFSVREMFIVRRGGSTLKICPHPPLAITPWQIVFATEQSIAENYDDPNAFWNAGWDWRDDFPSGSLLARSEYEPDDVAYLEKVVPMQWALARAAKPHLTNYFRPEYEDEVEHIYRQGESVLQPVGYAEEAKLAEFSCYLGEGQHIPGWEIYGLWGIIQDGKLSDGREVETLRVVFFDREMAVRERRPLLDIGAKVFYQDGPRKITEIAE